MERNLEGQTHNIIQADTIAGREEGQLNVTAVGKRVKLSAAKRNDARPRFKFEGYSMMNEN